MGKTTGWTNTLLITLAVAVGGYYVYDRFFKKKSDLLPALTEGETLKILVAFLEKLKLKSVNLINAFNNVKQQILAHGENMEDRKIMEQFIFPHFKGIFDDCSAKTYDEYDVLEEEVEEAVEAYIKMGREDIEDAAKQIKMIYREYGGEVYIEGDEFEDIPGSEKSDKEMSLEELLAVVDVITAKMQEVTKVFIGDFVEKHGKPTSGADVMKFNQGLMSVGQEAENQVFREQGINSMVFQKTVMKYNTSPELQQCFMVMQTATHQLIEEAGIDTSLFGVGM